MVIVFLYGFFFLVRLMSKIWSRNEETVRNNFEFHLYEKKQKRVKKVCAKMARAKRTAFTCTVDVSRYRSLIVRLRHSMFFASAKPGPCYLFQIILALVTSVICCFPNSSGSGPTRYGIHYSNTNNLKKYIFYYKFSRSFVLGILTK